MTTTHDETSPMLSRALNLLEFLRQCQVLRANPVHTCDAYARDGAVLWLDGLPVHEAVAGPGHDSDMPAEAPFLVLDRVPIADPPAPPPIVAAFLDDKLDDPDREPTLRSFVPVSRLPLDAREGFDPIGFADFEDVEGLADSAEAWKSSWRAWADQEKHNTPARDLYTTMFSTHLKAINHPEEFEMVLGFGLLGWAPGGGHPVVRRHVFTVPVSATLDDASGQIVVHRLESLDPPTLELDMVDPGLVANTQAVNSLRSVAQEFEHHPMATEFSGDLARRVATALDANGEYVEGDEPVQAGENPRISLSPAVILRKRSQRGLVGVYDQIIEQIQESGDVPAGLLPLVDPDSKPSTERDSTPGGVVDVDGEPFLPLPVNDRQLEVIRRVDSSAQTLVQGPPGTGKTHTAAALISHLLAQGKRILITAHTDRALYEVRSKLPHAIRPLSVSVVGSSRSDMAELKVAVEQISSRAADHDQESADEDIRQTLATIDSLRRERAELRSKLVEARRSETVEHQHDDRAGTLAALATGYQSDAEKFDWITAFSQIGEGSSPPLTNDQMSRLLTLLRDRDLAADEPESSREVVALSAVPTPHDFARLCAGEQVATTTSQSFEELHRHPAFPALQVLAPEVRSSLQSRVQAMAAEAAELERRREPWMNDALSDVLIGRAATWSDRAERVERFIETTRQHLSGLALTTKVTIAEGDRGPLIALAKALLEHLAQGGTIKALPNGQPKVGAFSPRIVKQSQPLFDSVRVDHLPPLTTDSLNSFLAYVQAEDLIEQLDRAWPANVEIPEEDTLAERVQWHATEVSMLRRVLALGDQLTAEEATLAELKVPKPEWSKLPAVLEFAKLVDAAAALDDLGASKEPLAALAESIEQAMPGLRPAQATSDLLDATSARDVDAYAAAYERTQRLHDVRSAVAERSVLGDSLHLHVPDLKEALFSDPHDVEWDRYLGDFEAAWNWSALGAWIRNRPTVDVNALQASLTYVEGAIRGKVEHLAAARAWNHAAGPDRLTGTAQADLAQYAQLVRRLGKGTGKYAAQQRGEIRRAMDRCRPAVPVWIMPIYRIAEQLRVSADMFDVVIVDEASQAGKEATFLQYLAPKIVVIGDDKQVSPAAVGVDQQQIIDLSNQYLPQDPYKASWQDPQRSLFDEAVMRFGGRTTLVEHRRCMPEIIGFSNRIAYEPDGVRLVPVRQFGADRLPPLKPVHVPDGYEKGTTNKVNPAEVDAIVDQIEACLADPRYDGMTMGVISLLGPAQARAIEKKLMERVAPEDWHTRDLRCGDAADFQGSERDVMFLSMVKAPDSDRRMGALTRDLYVQRYNVAASRAKDQMWLFHSMTLNDLGHPEDMRFALLDYVYGVANRTSQDETEAPGAVPDDVRVEPFDSLFEQRIYNRVTDRGYVVVPQYEASGYLIDLVVIGAKGRLAIECDGDRWHGPEHYERDLARQRDLERCGWQFHRIRESAYYLDPAAELEKLWQTLNELQIHPSGWMDEELAEEPEPDEAAATAEPVTDVQEPHDTPTYVPRHAHPAPAIPDEVEDEPEQDDHSEPATPQFVTQHDEPDPAPHVSSPATSDWIEETSDRAFPEATQASPAPPAAPTPERGRGNLPPYDTAKVNAPSVTDGHSWDIDAALIAIVSSEGPMLGALLQRHYVRASGGQRVGRLIASELNRHISALVRRGELVADNPTGESGVKFKIYRLPGQPEIAVRELGPRGLDEVPVTEIAQLMADTAEALPDGFDDSARLYRAVLDAYGLVRMTTGVQSLLETAHLLAEEAREASDSSREGDN